MPSVNLEEKYSWGMMHLCLFLILRNRVRNILTCTIIAQVKIEGDRTDNQKMELPEMLYPVLYTEMIFSSPPTQLITHISLRFLFF